MKLSIIELSFYLLVVGTKAASLHGGGMELSSDVGGASMASISIGDLVSGGNLRRKVAGNWNSLSRGNSRKLSSASEDSNSRRYPPTPAPTMNQNPPGPPPTTPTGRPTTNRPTPSPTMRPNPAPTGRPTTPGPSPGPTRRPTTPPPTPSPTPHPTLAPQGCSMEFYTLEDVAQRSSANSCWYILYGVVYDFTTYVDQHQGGRGTVLAGCGRDATSLYSIEPTHNRNLLQRGGFS